MALITKHRLACDFCGADQDAVTTLIAGPGSVAICNGCVAQCNTRLAEIRAAKAKAPADAAVQAVTRAAELVGSQSALARILSEAGPKPVSPAMVWNWINRDGGAPAEYCPLIEWATKGAVRCEELRHAVAWDVLRERRPDGEEGA